MAQTCFSWHYCHTCQHAHPRHLHGARRWALLTLAWTGLFLLALAGVMLLGVGLHWLLSV